MASRWEEKGRSVYQAEHHGLLLAALALVQAAGVSQAGLEVGAAELARRAACLLSTDHPTARFGGFIIFRRSRRWECAEPAPKTCQKKNIFQDLLQLPALS